MKKISYISLAVVAAIMSGCGGSTDSGTTTTALNTVTVERGPILGAKVLDANGQKATELGAGKYNFTSAPSYPILATGGVIDIDRDGTVSLGDVVNDMNLTTPQGSALTIVTTLATNTQTKAAIETLANSLNLTVDELYTKIPSTSKEIEAISNEVYKYAKMNNRLDLHSYNVTDINTTAITQAYASYDDNHDFEQEERDLITELSAYVDEVDDADIDDIKAEIEREHTDEEDNDYINYLDTLKTEYESEYGDLDYDDDGVDSTHNQGTNCATCHSVGTTLTTYSSDENEGNENEANENQFDSGATIFTTIDAANYATTKAASGYTLRLVLENGAGTETYNIGYGTGNVNKTFTQALGTTKYTAEVLDRSGNVVNSSASNSHDATRLDCNSCHSQAGIGGAPGRITTFKYTAPTPVVLDTNTTTVVVPDTNTTIPVVPDTNTTIVVVPDTNTTTPVVPDTNTTTVVPDTNTTTPVVALSFTNDVLPILDTNCKSCHGASGNFSITTSITPYAGVTPFVDSGNATASVLLQKASGVGHGGGTVLTSTSAEYITVRDWIAEGALDN
ncbi:hypothetical protein JHD47_03145 [Sulfurimonas sp. SAG-AH-194-L11]|nr:hypothetical protein [Sulfurimonas sp. SAG-AH-194-L11]MDF1876808.1 hypothetical protein [Sulfurimonas sp. SAG-AH-194-L11]